MHEIVSQAKISPIETHQKIRDEWFEGTENGAVLINAINALEAKIKKKRELNIPYEEEKGSHLFFTFLLIVEYQCKVRNVLKLPDSASKKEVIQILKELNKIFTDNNISASETAYIKNMGHFAGDLVSDINFVTNILRAPINLFNKIKAFFLYLIAAVGVVFSVITLIAGVALGIAVAALLSFSTLVLIIAVVALGVAWLAAVVAAVETIVLGMALGTYSSAGGMTSLFLIGVFKLSVAYVGALSTAMFLMYILPKIGDFLMSFKPKSDPKLIDFSDIEHYLEPIEDFKDNCDLEGVLCDTDQPSRASFMNSFTFFTKQKIQKITNNIEDFPSSLSYNSEL